MSILYKKRLKKAEKVAKLVSHLPFIRMIALTGSMTKGKIRKDSDIDFFIITAAGRIWTARFFLVSLLKMLRLYRRGNLSSQKAGLICPNRYLTDDYLLIHPRNSYHAQEYSNLLVLFDEGNTYRKFVKKNQWMKKYGYGNLSQPKIKTLKESRPSFFKKIIEWTLGDKIGDVSEKLFKKIQLKSILRDPRVNQPNTGLFVSDQELRFHPHPKLLTKK